MVNNMVNKGRTPPQPSPFHYMSGAILQYHHSVAVLHLYERH